MVEDTTACVGHGRPHSLSARPRCVAPRRSVTATRQVVRRSSTAGSCLVTLRGQRQDQPLEWIDTWGVRMIAADDGAGGSDADDDRPLPATTGSSRLAHRRTPRETTSVTAAPQPRTSTDLLRGDHSVTSAMEILQNAYLHAVVAASRCSLGAPTPDRFLDWTINHQSRAHIVDNEATLKVALKATQQIDISKLSRQADFSFTLKNEHLDYLSFVDPTISRILIVMTLPKTIDDWIAAEPNALTIRHCCYWVNLEGASPRGRSETTVRVPTKQIFDAKALCEIMTRIGRGGKP